MAKLVRVLRNFGIVVSNPNCPFMFRYKAVTQLAFKKTDEGRSCLAETSLQVLLTLFLTLTRVSAKHNKFSIND